MKFIWHNDEWVEAVRAPRPALFPAIIRDHMEPLRHMADGAIYDSKSKFRRVTQDHGMIEVGNDDVASARPKMRPVAEDIAEAWQMVEQGYHPPPLERIDEGEWKDVPVRVLDAAE